MDYIIENFTCSICFDRILSNSIKCQNTYCSTIICDICFSSYMDISIKEKTVPVCINNNCKLEYIIKNFKKNSLLYNNYIEHMPDIIIKNMDNKIQKYINIDNYIKDIRKDRNIFIEDKFPLAISYTATLFFSKKIKFLEKEILEKINEEDQKLKNKCMRTLCTGFINDKLYCSKCNTFFCEKCEMIKYNNHICKKENIETVNLKKNMIKCPECNIPIEKSSGCNLMTCTYCKTNFNYSNGQKADHGNNHNKILEIKNNSLSKSFYDYYENNKILDDIIEFENLKYPPASNKLFLKFIKIYIDGDTSINIKKKIVLQYQRYILDSFLYKQYYKIINEIEDDSNKQKIDKEKILVYIRDFKNLISNMAKS